MAGRILIAEDLASNRIVLSARLASAHYRTFVAAGRDDALRLARAVRPDVAIVGAGASLGAALDLVRALRADPAAGAAEVIVLLSQGDAARRCAALEAGASDVLDRRAGEELMLARVRNLMRARHGAAEFGLREEAHAALGFEEPAAAFERPGTIAVLARSAATAEGWRTALAPHLRDRIEILAPGSLVDEAPGGLLPDVYVIEADLAQRHDGLGLIAALRAGIAGRTAGIVAVVAPGDTAAAASALDLGADDAVEQPVDPAELLLRLRAQLRRKSRADRLRRQVSDGLRLAVTDPLTGLYNRRYAIARLGQLMERAGAGAGRPFAVMFLDIDFFKAINDRHGHSAGDAVLVEVARRLSAGVRAEDLVARFGGEEFLVVMPDTPPAAARRAAERLRQTIAAEAFACAGDPRRVSITVSVGVAVGGLVGGAAPEADPEADVAAVLAAADRALYASKAEGRNLVTLGGRAA